MKRLTLMLATLLVALHLVSGLTAQDYVRGMGGVVSSALMQTGGKYGFVGTSGGVALNAGATAIQAGDGGNYFYVSNGGVTVNSADFFLANGGTPRISFAVSATDGHLAVANGNKSIGSLLKVDALPVAGTCGTTPGVTAGSTPFAGSINVGTGGTATTCGVTFNGTAYPSAPFCTLTNQLSNVVSRYSATTTVLTLNTTTAWTSADTITWHCVSSK